MAKNTTADDGVLDPRFITMVESGPEGKPVYLYTK